MNNYPDVFISCSHSDRHSAELLRIALDELEITAGQAENIMTGDDFAEFIKTGQSASRVLVYLLSHDFQGPFIEKESVPWLKIIDHRRDPTIFPVQLTPALPSGQLKDFKMIQYFDAKDGIQHAIRRGLAQRIAEEVRREKIFICHASDDRKRIESIISTHKLGNVNVWFDSRTVPPEIDISIGISAGIARCSRFIAFVTSSFVNRLKSSKWLQLEINLALERELNTAGFAVMCALDSSTRSEDIPSVFRWMESPSNEFFQMFFHGNDL